MGEHFENLPKLLLLYSTFFCGGESGRLGWSVRTTLDDEYDDSSCRVPLLVIISIISMKYINPFRS